MDSMINHYTANKKVRNDDAYSPGGRIGLRPDRATIPYCQRAREAFPGVPIIAGGVEASLRRLAHYDYWSDTVRRAIMLDAKADLVVFGMGEHQIVTIASRLAAGETVKDLRDMRGVAYALGASESQSLPADAIVLPSYEEVKTDKHQFARATKIIHQETNPLNAKRLVQFHDRQAIVCNPPPLADQPGRHGPDLRPAVHAQAAPDVQGPEDPGLRGRQGLGDDHARLLRRLHVLLDHRAPGADHPVAVAGIGPGRAAADGPGPELLGRRLRHRRPDGQHVPDELHPARGRGQVQAALVRPSQDLQAAGHRPRPARRPDAAEPRGARASTRSSSPRGSAWTSPSKSPEYMAELVKHHVGGHLKVAPEHTDSNVLRLMKKPDSDDFEGFAQAFQEASTPAGKKQYVVPYFIASHPGSDLNAMIDLAVFLKRNGYQPDQVQDFIPAPFDIATCMYHTGLDPFTGEEVYVAKHLRDRKMQRALLQFFKPENYFMVREALLKAGRADLIGSGATA